MSDAWKFTDLQAAENEREWTAEPAAGGGITVKTYDDKRQLFDELTLRRFGAFIVINLPGITAVPQWLEFMRTAIEAHKRLRAIGVSAEFPTVLVKSEHIERLMVNGHFPRVLKADFPPRGSAILLGVRVAWDRELDQYAI